MFQISDPAFFVASRGQPLGSSNFERDLEDLWNQAYGACLSHFVQALTLTVSGRDGGRMEERRGHGCDGERGADGVRAGSRSQLCRYGVFLASLTGGFERPAGNGV